MMFNINDMVRVRLTERGRKIHRDEFEKYKTAYPSVPGFQTYSPPKEDADGWSEWQMWCLMELFGPHIFITAEPPFHSTIEICESSDTPAIRQGDAPATPPPAAVFDNAPTLIAAVNKVARKVFGEPR